MGGMGGGMGGMGGGMGMMNPGMMNGGEDNDSMTPNGGNSGKSHRAHKSSHRHHKKSYHHQKHYNKRNNQNSDVDHYNRYSNDDNDDNSYSSHSSYSRHSNDNEDDPSSYSNQHDQSSNQDRPRYHRHGHKRYFEDRDEYEQQHYLPRGFGDEVAQKIVLGDSVKHLNLTDVSYPAQRPLDQSCYQQVNVNENQNCSLINPTWVNRIPPANDEFLFAKNINVQHPSMWRMVKINNAAALELQLNEELSSDYYRFLRHMTICFFQTQPANATQIIQQAVSWVKDNGFKEVSVKDSLTSMWGCGPPDGKFQCKSKQALFDVHSQIAEMKRGLMKHFQTTTDDYIDTSLWGSVAHVTLKKATQSDLGALKIMDKN